MNAAARATCQIIEETLGSSSAFERIDEDLFIVKQGSAYVMVRVVPWDQDRVVVRCVAQMVTGIEMDGDLATKLLAMNAVMRFGTFAYEPGNRVLLFSHSILGGATLDPEELVSTLTDVAIIADDWDDRIIAEYGGRTMEDVITDEALRRIAESLEDEETTWDSLTLDQLPPPPGDTA